MKKQRIYIFLFDGFSDWEIAYLTPEINKNDDYELVYFSKSGDPILSMGGLKVMPDVGLTEVEATDMDMLILPGGTAWEVSENSEIKALVMGQFMSGRSIAAICAATTYLAQLGLLDRVNHTSNDLKYLKRIAPKYQGEGNYMSSLAVSDDNVITANGIAPIEFAKEIFLKINLYDVDHTEKWFQLFKNGIWAS